MKLNNIRQWKMGFIKLEIDVDIIYGQSQSSHVTVLCQGPDKKYNGFFLTMCSLWNVPVNDRRCVFILGRSWRTNNWNHLVAEYLEWNFGDPSRRQIVKNYGYSCILQPLVDLWNVQCTWIISTWTLKVSKN